MYFHTYNVITETAHRYIVLVALYVTISLLVYVVTILLFNVNIMEYMRLIWSTHILFENDRD